MAGRKSLKEEIQVVKFMAELASPTFKFIKKCLEEGTDKQKEWATEQMMKLYARAVPQETDITSDGKPIVLIDQATATKYGITPSPEADSKRPASV